MKMNAKDDRPLSITKNINIMNNLSVDRDGWGILHDWDRLGSKKIDRLKLYYVINVIIKELKFMIWSWQARSLLLVGLL